MITRSGRRLAVALVAATVLAACGGGSDKPERVVLTPGSKLCVELNAASGFTWSSQQLAQCIVRMNG